MENNYKKYANNIKQNVMKKRDFDNIEIRKITNNLNSKILDEIRNHKIKNSTIEKRIDMLSQNLQEMLKRSFSKNTNSLIINLNQVFANRDGISIGSENNNVESKVEINTILENYTKAVKSQVESFLEAYNVQASLKSQIITDVGNIVNGLKNKSINELEDYQEKINEKILSYITSQYEEYESEITNQEISNKAQDKNEKETGFTSSIKESVYTDEEIAKNAVEKNEETKEKELNEIEIYK